MKKAEHLELVKQRLGIAGENAVERVPCGMALMVNDATAAYPDPYFVKVQTPIDLDHIEKALNDPNPQGALAHLIDTTLQRGFETAMKGRLTPGRQLAAEVFAAGEIAPADGKSDVDAAATKPTGAGFGLPVVDTHPTTWMSDQLEKGA